jgi:hypothetical protein
MGEWSELHSGKLHKLLSSSNILSPIKSRELRWMRQGRSKGNIQNSRFKISDKNTLQKFENFLEYKVKSYVTGVEDSY